MHQPDLWMAHAQCLGLTIRYDLFPESRDKVGQFTVITRWSKTPKVNGNLSVAVDENCEQLVPELAYEASLGFLTTDPGYRIPRRVKHCLENYKDSPY